MMQGKIELKFQFRREREAKKAEKNPLAVVWEPSGNVISKEEENYQRLIREKLKAAADWDFRDSRQFKIG